jgi:hypothetical protein
MAWQEPIEEDIVPQQQRPGETKPTTGGAALLCKPTAVLSSYLNDISFASYASVTCPTLGYFKFFPRRRTRCWPAPADAKAAPDLNSQEINLCTAPSDNLTSDVFASFATSVMHVALG